MYSNKLKKKKKKLKASLREAKSVRKQHLEDTFKANNHKRMWDTMKTMTGMSSSSKPIVVDNELQFYKWF